MLSTQKGVESVNLLRSRISQLAGMERNIWTAEVARLPRAPRRAENGIDRGGKNRAPAHAEEWLIWVGELLVSCLVDKEHQAVRVNRQLVAVSRNRRITHVMPA